MFCITNFFGNLLFLWSVNTNILILPPPNYRACYATLIFYMTLVLPFNSINKKSRTKDFLLIESLHVNITKQIVVHSVLECAHFCRAEKTCQAFKRRNVYSDINCQITEGDLCHSTSLEENTEDKEIEKWTFYTLQTLGLVRNYKMNLKDSEIP